MRILNKIFLASTLLLIAHFAVAMNYKVVNVDEYLSAVKKLQPGDTLTLAKGVWKNQNIVFHGEGTKDKPIVLTVEKYGETTLEGQSSLQLFGNYLVVDGLVFINGYSPTQKVIEFRKGTSKTANYSVLKNVVVDHFNQPDRNTEDSWVNLWGHKNEVSNCYFGGKTNQGVTLIVWPNGEGHKENFHLIKNNYFGPRPRLGSNGGETIRVGTSHVSKDNSNTTIEANFFDQCNGEVEIVSIKSCENKILNNTFFECEGSLVLRHGDRNEVAGNFFLGNNKPSTGGVRIINEGHKVHNNYFYGLTGMDFRGALVVMNGVPNSVINRYHQVKDVEIMFNTWVDCVLPWQLCVGSDEERTARPESTLIANNVIYNTKDVELVKFFDKQDGITLQNNLLINKDGVMKGNGYVNGEVSVKHNTEIPFVCSDIKAMNMPAYLSKNKNIGMLSCSDNFNLIADKSNSGPLWSYMPQSINKPAPSGGKTISIVAGENTLQSAIKKSNPGDVIELESGVYLSSRLINIPHSLTIKASANAETRPLIKTGDEKTFRSFLEVESNLSLVLDGISFDASNKEEPIKYAISSKSKGDSQSSYNLFINDCEFANFQNHGGGAIIKAYEGTFADTLKITNSVFRDSYRGLALNAEVKEQKGRYNAEFMIIDNTVFKNITQWAFDFQRLGNDESTLGGTLQINHCIFDNIHNEGNRTIIKHTGLINIDIKNTVFYNSPNVKYPLHLVGRHNKLNNSVIYKSGVNHQNKLTAKSENMITQDPKFKANSFYELETTSPLIGKATDGGNIGLR